MPIKPLFITQVKAQRHTCHMPMSGQHTQHRTLFINTQSCKICYPLLANTSTPSYVSVFSLTLVMPVSVCSKEQAHVCDGKWVTDMLHSLLSPHPRFLCPPCGIHNKKETHEKKLQYASVEIRGHKHICNYADHPQII